MACSFTEVEAQFSETARRSERKKPGPGTFDRVPSRTVKSAHGRFGAC
jgi:hypothetical protein